MNGNGQSTELGTSAEYTRAADPSQAAGTASRLSDMSSSRWLPARPRSWLPLILILVAAIALRLTLMLAIWSNGGSPLLGDEGNYIVSAYSLSEGAGIPDLWLWVRAPGYIFFVAGVLAASGGSLWALNVVQALLAAPIALLAYALGRATALESGLSRRAGLWAAALVAFNPVLILYDNFFLSEQLTLLWLLLVVSSLAIYGAWCRAERARSWSWLLVAGISAGFGVLTRPSLLTYLPLVALWLLVWRKRDPARSLGAVALFTAAVLVVVLPWSARNYLHYGRFILVDTTGTYNFYTGNTSLSEQQAASAVARIPNHGDRQAYEFQTAVGWIAANKGEFLSRTWERLSTSWAPDPFVDLRYPVRDKLPGTELWGRDLYALTASVAYAAITILAFAGLLAARRSPLRVLTLLFVVSYLLAIGLSHNEFRYRLPVFGLLAPFAGYSLAARGAFWPWREGARWRWNAAAACVFAVTFAGVALQALVPGAARIAEAESTLKRAAGASDATTRAVQFEREAQAEGTSSMPYREAGAAWEGAGLKARALEDYGKALAREPGDWRARALMGALLRSQGDNVGSATTINDVPPTFNAIMQEWAWDHASAPPADVVVGGADIGWVKGFYVGETAQPSEGGFPYRWSTSRALIRVVNVPGGRYAALDARALPLASGEAREVRISIDGKPVGDIAMDANWKEYRFALPDSRATVATLQIDAPAERASARDRREVAVAVKGLRTVP